MFTNIFKKDRFPLLLLLVCFLAYGLFIPFLGFYWDDFPYMWFKHSAGLAGVIKAIAMDRPILGVFYAVPMAVLGESPLLWQIFAIFCRWIFSLSVFGFLKRVFPEHLKLNKYLILLFSVFPGFTQQWISVIYSHAFLIFALYFFSLSLFVDLAEKDNCHWSRHMLPILVTLVCLLATEYLAGLEVLRPLILYKIISKKYPGKPLSEKLKISFIKWAPYLFAVLVFLVYRIFFASSVLYEVHQLDSLSANPLLTILNLLQTQFLNIYSSTVAAWGQIIQPLLNLNLTSLFTRIYLVITVVTFFISIFLISRLDSQSLNHKEEDKSWNLEILIGSVFTLFFAGIPFWAVNLRPEVHFPYDRFFLPFILGSSALLLLVIRLFKKKPAIFSVLFSLIFSLSVSYQVYQANNFRNEWDYLKQFFQQLSWRIPSLEKNTLLVTDELPLAYYSDNSLTAAFNWLYSKENITSQLPYMINYTKARLGKSLPSLEPGTTIQQNYRIFTFSGSSNQLILFYHHPPGCVHLADPDLDVLNPLIPKDLRLYASVSRLDLISSQENQNPVFFITADSDATWCFYYQKASLAVQNQYWKEAARLGDIAFSLDDYPNDASERLPFIEGYAMIGDWEKAKLYSDQTIQVSALYKPMVCKLWEKLYQRSKDESMPGASVFQDFLVTNCAK